MTSQTESRPAATPVTRPPSFATLRRRVLAALDELKAHDIREIDVRGRTSIADLLIIASGTSSRHVKS
ncbi:MAG TPA: RsfS/YbeB/iojap family protein, partial [Rhodanobacteraceae bacterium]|nr:RsfS/YbeB/iojap family protein [Rhodanobacteraceae bacterium]